MLPAPDGFLELPKPFEGEMQNEKTNEQSNEKPAQDNDAANQTSAAPIRLNTRHDKVVVSVFDDEEDEF
jgi:hypothetical protein